MKCLVVHAHPDPESYSTALRERAVATLRNAGHEVDVLDLYALRYDPCLSEDEHARYDTIGLDHPDELVVAHITKLRWAEMLVFVYPTWWSGLPAILEGWLERTFLPQVAFALAPSEPGTADGASAEVKVRPLLGQVRRVVGITTYGSKRVDVRLLGDGGRRTITRAVRILCAKRCRTTWLGLHQLDGSPPETRAAFLDEVEATLAGIR